MKRLFKTLLNEGNLASVLEAGLASYCEKEC